MRVSAWTKLYVSFLFVLFVCLISVPIFAQNNTTGSTESTEAVRPVLAICEVAEATAESAAEATAEATAEADCIAPEDISIWYVNTLGGAGARVRECPASNCDIIMLLPWAEEIKVISTENGWHTILLEDNTVGYIATRLTTMYEPQAPVAAPASVAEASATPDPETAAGASGSTGGSPEVRPPTATPVDDGNPNG